MPIDVVVESLPLVYVRVHGVVTVADVGLAAAEFDRIFARGTKITSLADTRKIDGIPGAAERRAIAEWMRRIEPEMRRSCVGSANLIGSSVVRGAMTAIYWLFEPPVPQYYPASLTDGLDWCVGQLASVGVDATRQRSELRLALEGAIAV